MVSIQDSIVRIITGISLIGMFGMPASAQQASACASVRAKGVVVCEAQFPTCGEVEWFDFEISTDGEVFKDADPNPSRGMPFGEHLVWNSAEAPNTVLIVPVVGKFGMGSERFLFETPGTYYLRWRVSFVDRQRPALRIDQTLEVGPPFAADLEFLKRIGQRDSVAALFGREPPEKATEELLSVVVAGMLLKRAESDPVDDPDACQEVTRADLLMDVARQLAESSYAPYAAYYAGAIYRQALEGTPQARAISYTTRNHELYGKADEALRFAVQSGDLFLKPRALCALAYLRVCTGAWDEADGLLKQAEEVGAGQGPVQGTAAEVRRQLLQARQEVERKISEGAAGP